MDTFKIGSNTGKSEIKLSLDQNTDHSKSSTNIKNLIRKLMVKMSNLLPKTHRQVYFTLGQTTNDQTD